MGNECSSGFIVYCSVNVDVKMFFLFGFSRIADPNELLVEADIVNKPREVT